MVSGEMEVVELPEQQAIVTGIQPRYRIGDLVDGNCSIKFSKPAANLTWTINGIVVPPHHIKTYQIEKYADNNLESVVSAIHFMVTTQHFLKGQMRLKCTASIFDIFKEEIESIIEEDRPRIMASGRSYDMNNYPYEPHSSGDGFEDHNESYLTYYSAADITSAAAPTTAKPYKIFGSIVQKRLQHIWAIICCCYASITTTADDDALLTVFTSTARRRGTTTATTLETITNKTWQQQLKQLQQTVKRHAAQILEQMRLWQSYYLKVISNYYSRKNGIANATTTTSGAAVEIGVVGAVTIIIILLTHHFISCQNRCDTKKERAAAMTSQRTLLTGTLSKIVAAATTSASAPAPAPATSTFMRTTATKRTYDNNSRKSFYNCSSASGSGSDAKTKTLNAIPLQKLEQHQHQQHQREQQQKTTKRSCCCHQCRNQNDSASDIVVINKKNIATIATASDCKQEQERQQQELSLTLAIPVAAGTTKIECNFVKNMTPKKEHQTLLMSVQQKQKQQQEQQQIQQQCSCHFNFSAAIFKMPPMTAARKTFPQC